MRRLLVVLRRFARHSRGIRLRLTLWYVALLAIILLLFCAFVYFSLARTLNGSLDQAVVSESRTIVDALEVKNGRARFSEPVEQFPVGTLVILYDASGAPSSGLPPGPAFQEFARAAALPGAPTSPPATLLGTGNEHWRVLTIPIHDGGKTIAVLQVARSEADLRSALDRLLLLMGLAIPITLVLAVAGGLFLAGRALDPIDRITRAAARIGAEDLSRRLAMPATPDEVGRLASTFDRMLERLEEAFARQRRFTADASHELRTPLALLSGRTEVALERARTPAEYRQVLEGVRDDAERMSRLLSELLLLARADRGQEMLSLEALALDELVADTVGALVPLAEERGLTLEPGSLAHCTVLGDQTRLTQLLVNLVGNALKYTPAGGVVTVSVAVHGSEAVLAVADTGIGISSEHLPRLFERFYRVDSARSRAEGGAGLGLAISEWIVSAHGGRLEVESTVGAGSVFRAHLPLAPDIITRPRADGAPARARVPTRA